MKTFDWEYAKNRNSPEHFFLLKEAFKSGWSEDKYVKEFNGLPGPHKPANGRREFKYLTKNFNFF